MNRLKEFPLYLAEYAPTDTQTVILTKEDGSILHAKGLKITRLVDTDLKELAAYDPNKDGVDLTCIDMGHGKATLASVSSLDGKSLSWVCLSLISADPAYTEFIVGEKWECTPDEAIELDSIFPGYFEHCSLDSKDFVQKNKPTEAYTGVELPHD